MTARWSIGLKLGAVLVPLMFGAGAKAADNAIAAWGDSLTEGLYMRPEATYPAQAAALFSPPREIANFGLAAETVTQLAGRIGAIPVTVEVDGGTIPANGGIVVHGPSINILNSLTDYEVTAAGTLCGVAGTVTGIGFTSWTFKRTAAGDAVPCAARAVFAPDAANQGDRTQWLWVAGGTSDAGHDFEKDLAAIVASLGHDRYLIGSVVPSKGKNATAIAAIGELNARLKATYGDHFVDLVSVLQAAGNGSDGDKADIVRGIVPRSLRADEINLKANGYAVVAQAFAAATKKLGY